MIFCLQVRCSTSWANQAIIIRWTIVLVQTNLSWLWRTTITLGTKSLSEITIHSNIHTFRGSLKVTRIFTIFLCLVIWYQPCTGNLLISPDISAITESWRNSEKQWNTRIFSLSSNQDVVALFTFRSLFSVTVRYFPPVTRRFAPKTFPPWSFPP